MSWRFRNFELDNEIHPIFAKHNFPGADYEKLSPTLRLASNLLTAKPLLPFWHAIFFGEEHTLSPEEVLHAEKDELPRTFWRKNKILSLRSEALTKLNLIKLASLVKFYRDDGRIAGQGYGGMCSRHNATELRDSDYDYPGTGSSIYYSESMYQAAIQSFWPIMRRDCVRCRQNILPILTDRFHLAKLLVHEVAHAATHYVLHYSIRHEDFFEDYPLAECGYAWEFFAFGGKYTPFTLQTITGLPQYDDMLVDFDVYGDMEFLETYGTRNKEIDLSRPCITHLYDRIPDRHIPPIIFTPALEPMECPDGEAIPYRAGISEATHIPHVAAPSSYIFDLFTPPFWDKTVEIQGADALNVVKRAQWGFLWDKELKDWGRWACFDHDPESEVARVEGVSGWVPVPREGIQGLARMRDGLNGLVGSEMAQEMQKKEDAKEVRRRLDEERREREMGMLYGSW